MKYLLVWITTRSLFLFLLYTFLISKTVITSALILSPLGTTSLYKTEKPIYPTERDVNITPIPVLYKNNFTKLPVWDFEDVYLRNNEARRPVSATFPIPFSLWSCAVILITFSVDLSGLPSKQRGSKVQRGNTSWHSAVAVQRSTQHNRMESISTLQQSLRLHGIQVQWW